MQPFLVNDIAGMFSGIQAALATDLAEIVATVCSLVVGFQLVSMVMRGPKFRTAPKKVTFDAQEPESSTILKPLTWAGVLAKFSSALLEAPQPEATAESTEVEDESDDESVAGAFAAPAPAALSPPKKSRQQFHLLLEHYGAFGVEAGAWSQSSDEETWDDAPGTWSQSSEDEDMEELELEATEVSFAAVPASHLDPIPSLAGRSPELPQWQALLENYGVFGAAAGSWRKATEEQDWDEEEVEEYEVMDEEEMEEDSISSPGYHNHGRPCWKALFENYGVFGSAAGSWTKAVDGEDEEAAAEESEEEFDMDHDAYGMACWCAGEDQKPTAGRTAAWSLMEQYGVFGAAPGTWAEAA